MTDLTRLPESLPRPLDDGAAAHLTGLPVPDVALPSTLGGVVRVAGLTAPDRSDRAVLYLYPMTGRPGVALPDGWDSIPGARGCTPQACAFRDHHAELTALGATVFGVSVQDTGYQVEMAERLHLPFAVLSDARFELTDALRLPTFEAAGMRLMKRLTLILRHGRIEHVFYPVFPTDGHAAEVIAWLRSAR